MAAGPQWRVAGLGTCWWPRVFGLGVTVVPLLCVRFMQRSTQPTGRGPVALIDELVSQQRVLAQAQARNAALMLEFSDARRSQDRQAIAERKTEGHDPRYRAGEFAAMEIGLAMRASKHTVQRTMSMARRLQQEAPDAWDCWQAGDIDHDKAIRINRALRRLLRDTSKDLLNREGKEQLALEIQREAVRPMGIEIAGPEPVTTAAAGAASASAEIAKAKPRRRGEARNPIQHVHFSSFIIQ